MLWREICRVLGYFFFCFAALLLVPLAVAVYFQYSVDPTHHPQPHSTGAFFGTALFCAICGIIFSLIGREAYKHIFWREGLVLSVLIWVLAPALGALPFWASGTLKNPVHAYFEAVSGFTTTGATVIHPKKYDERTGKETTTELTLPSEPSTTYTFFGTVEPVRDSSGKIVLEGIEAISQALVFWRSFMQWLGGIGIVVLFITLLPLLGIGGKVLIHAEMPGPIKDLWTPRARQTMTELGKIYVGLTLLQIVLLHLTNRQIGWMESINLAFTTISTGGFTPRNDNIAAYNSPITEWIVMIFMILGSINFSLYYHMSRGRLYRLNDPELLTFGTTLIVGAAIASWQLWGSPITLHDSYTGSTYSAEEALRYGCFQWVSALTTTGFASADYDLWPLPVQLIMFLAMFLGGMSGSTAGGMKTIRQYISFHVIKNRLESMFRPRAVKIFEVGGRPVDSSIAVMVLAFLVTLGFLTMVGWLLLVLDGAGIWLSLSAVACSINNVGMAFGVTGPDHSFASFSDFALLVSTQLMLLGRLEFFAFLVLLLPAFWRKAA